MYNLIGNTREWKLKGGFSLVGGCLGWVNEEGMAKITFLGAQKGACLLLATFTHVVNKGAV